MFGYPLPGTTAFDALCRVTTLQWQLDRMFVFVCVAWGIAFVALLGVIAVTIYHKSVKPTLKDHEADIGRLRSHLDIMEQRLSARDDGEDAMDSLMDHLRDWAKEPTDEMPF